MLQNPLTVNFEKLPSANHRPYTLSDIELAFNITIPLIHVLLRYKLVYLGGCRHVLHILLEKQWNI